MKREHVNLNKPEIKIVIQNLLWNNWGVKFPLSKIQISDKEDVLYLCGREIFRYDRHHHETSEKHWPISIYLYLAAVDSLSQNTKYRMFLSDKEVKKEWIK